MAWSFLLVSLHLFNAELSPKRYWRGPRSQEVGHEGGLCLTLHCHRQNDSRIKMGSGEGHFNVLSIARDQGHATDSVSAQTTTFEVRGEPKRNRTEVLLLYQHNALPLGQTSVTLGPESRY